jgi:hypothetical protein
MDMSLDIADLRYRFKHVAPDCMPYVVWRRFGAREERTLTPA